MAPASVTGQPIAERFLGIAAVEAVVGLERTTIGRWVRAGRFPAPARLGMRRYWLSSVVAAWVAEQAGKVQS